MKRAYKNGLIASMCLIALVLSVLLYNSYAKALNYDNEAIALTFDDGPDPRFTPAILDILKQYNVHATFFITGENARLHPELVKRIVSEGNDIANHTMNHPHLEKLPLSEVELELSEWDRTIYAILGYLPDSSHFFRPPRGFMSNNIIVASEELHKEIILWDVCVENHTTKNPQAVRNRVMKLLDEKNGGILLAHDGNLDRTLTRQSFPLIMKEISKRGYQIVTLDEYVEMMRKSSKVQYAKKQ